MVKNGTFGTVLRFFQKIECNYKQFHLITILWLLWLNKLLLYKSNALCAMETMLKNEFVGFVWSGEDNEGQLSQALVFFPRDHVEIREPNGSKIQIKIIATVAKNLFFTKNFSALGRNIYFSTKCFNFHVRQHMAPQVPPHSLGFKQKQQSMTRTTKKYF